MFESEIPYKIEENRIEYIQHVKCCRFFLIMVFNFYSEKYGLYCIPQSLISNKIDADKIVKKFTYLPLHAAKEMCSFPLSEDSYGF